MYGAKPFYFYEYGTEDSHAYSFTFSATPPTSHLAPPLLNATQSCVVAKRQERAQSASEDDPPFRVLVAFQEDGESGAEEKVISKVAEAEEAEEAAEAAKAKATNIFF